MTCAALAFVLVPAAQAATLAAGSRHTLVRTSEGRVWAFGDNGRGQLGTTPAEAQSTVPLVVEGLTDVVAVAAGAHHSLALTRDGAVYVWGANDSGQVGDGTRIQRKVPRRVSELSDVAAIAAGAHHSLALTADGSVWVWGENSRGQLGDGSRGAALRPQRTTLSGVRNIGAGATHSLAATSDGGVLVWGDDGTAEPQDADADRLTPERVAGLDSIVAVSGGTRFSLALTKSGQVFAWGMNDHGQLGRTPGRLHTLPRRVPLMTPASSIAAGGRHALAVTVDGLLMAWGDGADGQLGQGRRVRQLRPAQVMGLSTVEVAAASSGAHSVAVTTDGVVWAFGDNSGGQLGDGTLDQRRAPTQITEAGYACLVGTPVLEPAGGFFSAPQHVMVRCATPGADLRYTVDGGVPRASDSVLAQHQRLLVDRTMTLRVRAFRNGMPASNIAVGVYVVGAQGGTPESQWDSKGDERETPRPLTGEEMGTVAAGLAHSVVLKSDGTVWTFGGNW